MLKEIMRDGNSHKIRLTYEDVKLYNLKVGDVVNIEISKINKNSTKAMRLVVKR